MNFRRQIPLIIIAGLLVSVASARQKEAPARNLEIDVEFDTYVRNGTSAGTNYSDAPELRTINHAGDQSEILLRFLVPLSASPPDAAFIWVRTTSQQTDPVENSAHLVPNDHWNPRTVTWNNRPATNGELDAWVTEDEHSVKIEVTRQVAEAAAGDGVLSIAIRSPHDVGARGTSVYHSIETPGSFSSKLMIRYNEPKEYVLVNDSIQEAIDSIHRQGGGQVILSRGRHLITESLAIHSNVTLRGIGPEHTSIVLDKSKNVPLMIGTREGALTHDVTIRDLKLDGQQDTSERSLPGDTNRHRVRGETFGMLFTDQSTGNKFERIRIQNIAVTRCAMGIHFKGVDDLRILDSEIRGNGCLIGYDHNIYFRRARNSLLKNLNISDCTAGNGFNLSTDCFNVVLDHCNASNNHFRGIRFEASDGGARMMIIGCTANRNGARESQVGIRVANVRDFVILDSTASQNGDHGIYCVGSRDGLIKGNTATGNRKTDVHLVRCRNVSPPEGR